VFTRPGGTWRRDTRHALRPRDVWVEALALVLFVADVSVRPFRLGLTDLPVAPAWLRGRGATTDGAGLARLRRLGARGARALHRPLPGGRSTGRRRRAPVRGRSGEARQQDAELVEQEDGQGHHGLVEGVGRGRDHGGDDEGADDDGAPGAGQQPGRDAVAAAELARCRVTAAHLPRPTIGRTAMANHFW
jgi:hypothetical protein